MNCGTSGITSPPPPSSYQGRAPDVLLFALLDALEAERPDLFGLIQALPTDNSISHDERACYVRQIIRQDYENYLSDFVSQLDTSGLMPPAPPSNVRSESQQEALDLAKQLDAEDEKLRSIFYCNICLEQTPIHGSYSLDCSHRVCSECLEGYINSKINSNEVSNEQLVCPLLGCSCPIPPATVKGCTVDVGNADMFEKYDQFATEGFIEKEILAGSCMRCPNEPCNYVFQWNPDGSALPFECLSCSSSYCLNCELVDGGVGPGHAPYTCAIQAERNQELEEERRKFEEWKAVNARAAELFEELVKRNGWKKCPHCTAVIERTAGCDHMTCQKCRCAFCFVCGKYNAANPTSRGDCGSTCGRR